MRASNFAPLSQSTIGYMLLRTRPADKIMVSFVDSNPSPWRSVEP
jgi:hypothetical protein